MYNEENRGKQRHFKYGSKRNANSTRNKEGVIMFEEFEKIVDIFYKEAKEFIEKQKKYEKQIKELHKNSGNHIPRID